MEADYARLRCARKYEGPGDVVDLGTSGVGAAGFTDDELEIDKDSVTWRVSAFDTLQHRMDSRSAQLAARLVYGCEGNADDALDLRCSIEVRAAELAAEMSTEAAVANLRAAVAGMKRRKGIRIVACSMMRGWQSPLFN